MNLNKSELKSSLLPYSEVVECKMHCIEQVDCFVLPSSPLPSHPYQGCIYTNGSIVCVMCMLTVAHGNVSGSSLLQKKKMGAFGHLDYHSGSANVDLCFLLYPAFLDGFFSRFTSKTFHDFKV